MAHWTLAGLHQAAIDDRRACQTRHETLMADAINRKELRALWNRIRETRKPTKLETHVAEYWGFAD